jgi:putative colanic acid biosynthesis UDP-glucose lipid carrier transferase
MLMGSAWYFGESFSGPYIILALLVFSLTFPGKPRAAPAPGAIGREVIGGWILILALLLMLGWATRTVGSFDERVLVTWGVVTPFVLVFAHLATPALLPRLMAAEGMNRVAVIAGAGSLGTSWPSASAPPPYLGVQIAGFFDDRSVERLGGMKDEEILGNVEELAEVRQEESRRPHLPHPADGLAAAHHEAPRRPARHHGVGLLHPRHLPVRPDPGRMDTIGGCRCWPVCETPFFGMNALAKRLSDIVLATIILILIAPILAVGGARREALLPRADHLQAAPLRPRRAARSWSTSSARCASPTTGR